MIGRAGNIGTRSATKIRDQLAVQLLDTAPDAMVAGYTQLLQRRYRGKLDSEADEFIDFAVDGAVRMQALINDLLTYSRVGSRAVQLEPTDSRLIMEQVVADLAAAIKENGASVSFDDLPTLAADPVQLRQVLQNLVANAIKFRGDVAPNVEVSARRGSAEWVVMVRDNGIGIESQHLERIFGIFQRLHSRDEHPGTGIGLAVCKKLMERHGGRIWVESQPGVRAQRSSLRSLTPAPGNAKLAVYLRLPSATLPATCGRSPAAGDPR